MSRFILKWFKTFGFEEKKVLFQFNAPEEILCETDISPEGMCVHAW